MKEKLYLIWSEEHQAWWAANASGYTRSIRKAGRYTPEQVEEIVSAANEHLEPGQFHEVALPDPL